VGYCASESGSIPLRASKEEPTAATTARFLSSAASSRIRKTASSPGTVGAEQIAQVSRTQARRLRNEFGPSSHSGVAGQQMRSGVVANCVLGGKSG
jgi:hypothetical protein